MKKWRYRVNDGEWVEFMDGSPLHEVSCRDITDLMEAHGSSYLRFDTWNLARTEIIQFEIERRV